jgi:hypothetical protein
MYKYSLFQSTQNKHNSIFVLRFIILHVSAAYADHHQVGTHKIVKETCTLRVIKGSEYNAVFIAYRLKLWLDTQALRQHINLQRFGVINVSDPSAVWCVLTQWNLYFIITLLTCGTMFNIRTGQFSSFCDPRRSCRNYMWEAYLLKQLHKHVRFAHGSHNG